MEAREYSRSEAIEEYKWEAREESISKAREEFKSEARYKFISDSDERDLKILEKENVGEEGEGRGRGGNLNMVIVLYPVINPCLSLKRPPIYLFFSVIVERS